MCVVPTHKVLTTVSDVLRVIDATEIYRLVLLKFPAKISEGLPDILAQAFRGFLQPLPVNTEMVPELGLLPNTRLLTIHYHNTDVEWSAHPLRPYS